MDKKLSITIVVLVIVAIVGFFIFINYEPYTEDIPEENDIENEINLNERDEELFRLINQIVRIEEEFNVLSEEIENLREDQIERADTRMKALRDKFVDLDDEHMDGDITDEEFAEKLDDILEDLISLIAEIREETE